MSTTDETLAGFDRFEQDGRIALVRHEQADALCAVLFGAGEYRTQASYGRGAVYRFLISDGEAIMRPYRRGGVLARYREDRYWLVNRALNELKVLDYAFRLGLAVPEPLGALWEQRGYTYTGAITTRAIDAITLQDWAGTHPSDEDVEAVLRNCGEAIRAMHDAGIYHADLQIRNILVAKRAVTLIDFDNATRHDSLSDIPRARNLLRLRRSIEKNGLPSTWFAQLVDAYGTLNIPGWLSAAYRLKGTLSDGISGRP